MPLNPDLYEALALIQGGKPPKISREGTAFRYEIAEYRGSKRVHPLDGEQYAINCPFCGDSRQRLFVHYMYGMPSPTPVCPGRMIHLSYCQNEQAVKRQLFQYLGNQSLYVKALELGILKPPAAVKESPKQTLEDLPEVDMGTVIPFTSLGPGNRAFDYLYARGYNPYELTTSYFAGVSASHPDKRVDGMISGRIIFPFYYNRRLVSWQARLAYNPQKGERGPGKWVFPGGCPKVLWNIDLASEFKATILCEGILSAVNFGPAAMAIGGKTLMPQMVELIAKRWKTVVVCLDPDAGRFPKTAGDPDYQERAVHKLREAGVPHVYSALWSDAEGKQNLDPGDIGKLGCYNLLKRTSEDVVSEIPYMR